MTTPPLSAVLPATEASFPPARNAGSPPPRGFTLVELLVSMAVLSLVMVLLLSMVNSVSTVWRRTSGKISAFEGARAGFEAVTRKLSQATLNTYWDYEYPKKADGVTDDTTKPPTAYVRQSELHLISGQARDLLTANTNVSTHAIFFQAPLGYSSLKDNTLQTLLNISGFFVEHKQESDLPEFLKTLAGFQKKTRYRLMEVWQPSENFRVYEPTKAQLTSTPAKRTEWFTAPLNPTPPATSSALPLAENIIALVIWPRRAATDTRSPITPDFSYNTRSYLDFSASALAAKPASDPVKLSRNQLPPVLDVTMIAIDEESAARLEVSGAASDTKALLAPGALFKDLGGKTTLDEQEAYFQADLAKLTAALNKNRVTYRIFRTALPLRQAKWSEQ